MNPVDLVAVVLVVLALLLGIRSGALPQLGGLAGAVAGGAVALLALPLLETPLRDVDPTIRAFSVLGGLLLAVGVGEAIGSGAGRGLARGLGDSFLGTVDRSAGGLVGIAQALLIVWLAGGMLAEGPLPRLATHAQTSVAVRALTAVLPAPTEFAAGLGRVLDASGLPDVFVGLEPLPAPPVEEPSDPQVRAIGDAAAGGLARVAAETCGRISTGSAFTVAPGYLVTNAHVVAGGGVVRIVSSGQVTDATVVLFDPALDVAVLWSPDAATTPLRLAAADPVRGAGGAALGYPGGGGLSIIPAAVTDAYAASGRDIYGRDRVTRPVLELQAAVDRGNSGGPFVLEDGTVGGVVFAESRTDASIGYALSPTSVATRIGPALSRRDAVPTGECLP